MVTELVSQIVRNTKIESVWELGAEEIVWTYGIESNKRLKKTA
jgi:hypothetical protein